MMSFNEKTLGEINFWGHDNKEVRSARRTLTWTVMRIAGHLEGWHVLNVVGVVERVVAPGILPAVALVAVNLRSS